MLRHFHFLECISDFKEVVNVERRLEGWNSVRWNLGGSAAVWTSQGALLSSTSELLQTFLTEDVEALEEFGCGVGIEADRTCQLVGQLLKGLISNTGTLSHFQLERKQRYKILSFAGHKEGF